MFSPTGSIDCRPASGRLCSVPLETLTAGGQPPAELVQHPWKCSLQKVSIWQNLFSPPGSTHCRRPASGRACSVPLEAPIAEGQPPAELVQPPWKHLLQEASLKHILFSPRGSTNCRRPASGRACSAPPGSTYCRMPVSSISCSTLLKALSEAVQPWVELVQSYWKYSIRSISRRFSVRQAVRQSH